MTGESLLHAHCHCEHWNAPRHHEPLQFRPFCHCEALAVAIYERLLRHFVPRNDRKVVLASIGTPPRHCEALAVAIYEITSSLRSS